MTAIAPSWINPGTIQLNVETPQNNSQYLRSGNSFTDSIQIRVNLVEEIADLRIDTVVEDEQEVIQGSIKLETEISEGIYEGVDEISIAVYLEYKDGERVDQQVVRTSNCGLAVFVFNSEPQYGDTSTYGELTIKLSMSPNAILSDESINNFNNKFNQANSIVYEYEGDDSSIFQSIWFYILVFLSLIHI